MINRHSLTTIAWKVILSIASCLNTVPSEARQMPKIGASPKQGKILQLTNGDLICYVQLVDARGKNTILELILISVSRLNLSIKK
ncbi:hypothetical protein [Chamaesiphon sp. VAR_48_metabat_403]|uniref:hypothetical protein n=1 Tax=Chamaesiphon sp. VAR_48_metabat_403 TaxID=2964700 RepID=UPI00286E84D6|nr:hypothetical protein [Chamaesiphon sp. VAR_48_metabat_403]